MADFEPSLLTTDAAERGRFIDVLRETGSVTAAALAVGCSRNTAYKLRRRDRAFAEAWDVALGNVVATALETALIARATNGVERYKFNVNDTVEIRVEHDNKLAMWLLGKLLPGKFGDGTGATAAPPPRVMTRDEFVDRLKAVRLAGRRARKDVAAAAKLGLHGGAR